MAPAEWGRAVQEDDVAATPEEDGRWRVLEVELRCRNTRRKGSERRRECQRRVDCDRSGDWWKVSP
jgi:hypothetical protein